MDPIELASSLRTAVFSLYKGLCKNRSSVAGCSVTEIETIGHIASDYHKRLSGKEKE
jgi:hypothetical protein